MIKIRRKQKESKKKLFIVLFIIFIVLLVIKGMYFGPLSDSKAIERTKINIQNGAHCSGYNNNTADGTRVVVFRDNVTNEVVDSFEVSWDLGSKIYYEEI